jgi:hypothetical protein
MEQLINKITEEAFSKYGNSTLFREYNFTPIVVNKLAAVYRVQSAINYPYIYEIQIHVFMHLHFLVALTNAHIVKRVRQTTNLIVVKDTPTWSVPYKINSHAVTIRTI